MQSGIEQLAALPKDERDEILASLSEHQLQSLLYDWRGFLARPNQIMPDGDWDIWLMLAGRGFGKTRAGAEAVREWATGNPVRIALIGETSADLEKTMIEGESGILGVCPPEFQPIYTKKPKPQLVWPNGTIATGFNATSPEQLRGPQFHFAWCDEVVKWRYARDTWDQLQFGLRLGDHPRIIVTTTPKPIELLKAIIEGKEGKVEITRGSTYENKTNLSARFLEKIRERYEGTRLGRQELNAEMLGDTPGALWNMGSIDLYRARKTFDPSTLKRIVIAIDPATTATEKSDKHGILAIGIGHNKEGYVLEDASLKGSPHQWGMAAATLYKKYGADRVVAEVNQGGDMVEHVLRSVSPNIPVKKVHATRGKHIRAEPVSALYEQGRVHHVGQFPELEEEMCYMTSEGYEGIGSPDRLDALVWGLTDLFPEIVRRIRPQDTEERFAPIPGGGGSSWMG